MLQLPGGQVIQLNSSMDTWTLGMILLHCMCLEYQKTEFAQDTFEEILGIFMKVSSPSLINVEEKIDPKDLNESELKGENSDSDNSSGNDINH